MVVLHFQLDALNGSSWRVEAERWRGVAAAERSSAARADRDRQQRAQKDLDTSEYLTPYLNLEFEVIIKLRNNKLFGIRDKGKIPLLAILL